MHGEGDPFAPGHVKPRKYDSELHQINSKHSELFLETEKNDGAIRNNRTPANRTPNQIDIKHSDEPTSEMSAL